MLIHPIPNKTLLMFDVDGTLTQCTIPGQPCPNRDGEWKWKPGVLATLHTYPRTTKTAWISNQGGIALGYLSEADLKDIYVNMCVLWGFPTHILYCQHDPNLDCACRKPSPLMLLASCQEWKIPLHNALFVGDQNTDQQAAARAGVSFIWAKDFFGGAAQYEQ